MFGHVSARFSGENVTNSPHNAYIRLLVRVFGQPRVVQAYVLEAGRRTIFKTIFLLNVVVSAGGSRCPRVKRKQRSSVGNATNFITKLGRDSTTLQMVPFLALSGPTYPSHHFVVSSSQVSPFPS